MKNMSNMNIKILAVFIVGFGFGLLLDATGLYRFHGFGTAPSTSRYDYQEDAIRMAQLKNQLLWSARNQSKEEFGQGKPISKEKSNGTNPILQEGYDWMSAEELYLKVPILCAVLTSPQTLDTRTIFIKRTWAKRCNKIVYISSVVNDTFPTIDTGVAEGRAHLTQKVFRGLQKVYTDYFTSAYDWIFLGDDDTYAILENMRYFLKDKDTNAPIYYGHHFKVIVPGGYFSGGGGIVVGRESLRRLFTKKNNTCIKRDGGDGDWQLGMCLHEVGVIAGNSTDINGHTRFHCFPPDTHIGKGYPDWYLQYDANNATGGIDQMSDYAITFHYVAGIRMLEFDYYLYHLVRYGIIRKFPHLNQPKERHPANNSTKPLALK